jgi:hypothetical protein
MRSPLEEDFIAGEHAVYFGKVKERYNVPLYFCSWGSELRVAYTAYGCPSACFNTTEVTPYRTAIIDPLRCNALANQNLTLQGCDGQNALEGVCLST